MKLQRVRPRSRLSRRVFGGRRNNREIEHSRMERVLKGIAGFIVVSTVLTLAFGVAFLFMAQVYLFAGGEPAPLAKQVINSLVGLFLLGIVGTLMSRIFRS